MNQGNEQMNAMQQQMMQQQMMMQQMMQQMMNQNAGGQQTAPAQQQASANPTTKEEIQAMLDSLDLKLASGEISEAVYNKLVAKWQERLNALG
jgi:hypothetical protein